MKILRAILFILVCIPLIATLLPLWDSTAWWVRAFEFPRIQILSFGLIILVLYTMIFTPLALYEKATLACLFLALLYQGYRIFPYTPLAREQVVKAGDERSEGRISVLVTNVLMTNRKTTGLIDQIREWKPDIVCAVETDDWWEEQLRVIEDDYPFTLKEPLDNTYGMLLYSRLELIEPETKYLVEEGIPSMHGRVKLANQQEVKFHCLHPEPPYPKESKETTERDAELLVVGRTIGLDNEMPTILLGDLNDVAWSHTTRLLQKVSGLLDPRIGRGLYNSFGAGIPLVGWPLDHIFHTSHFKLVRLKRLKAYGSDHYPVYGEFNLEWDAPIVQEEPVPDLEDMEEAEERIEEGEPMDEPPSS